MKKILITGVNSYVGNSFEKWLKNYPGEYEVDKISLRNDSWKDKSFSNYDVILHAVGIAHIKETRENEHLYYEINRDLAYEVAKKAKDDGVNHFVFLSSMSVYGIETGTITEDTIPNPKSNYGKSKLEAEELIDSLSSESFKGAILRPPMIYGKECKGNYPKLSKIAEKLPLFPDVDNRRSMIFIENLSEYIRLIIDDNKSGVFHPQNLEYVNTSDLVKLIGEIKGRNIKMTKLFNPLLDMLSINVVKKVFGDLIYDQKIDDYDADFMVYDFETSIKLTEKMK